MRLDVNYFTNLRDGYGSTPSFLPGLEISPPISRV